MIIGEGTRPSTSRGMVSVLSMARSTASSQALTPLDLTRRLPTMVPSGEVRTYVRDENRCVLPADCVKPGMCAMFIPSCPEGYKLSSWSGGTFACPQYACDVAFSL